MLPRVQPSDGAQLVVGAGEGAEAVFMLSHAVDAVVQAPGACGSVDVAVSGVEAEGTGLEGAAVAEGGRGREVDDVDGASGGSAAEEGRAGAFEDLDPLDAVEGVGNAAGLVAVGEAVVVDLGGEAADEEVVVGAEAVVSALHDTAGVADGVEKAEAALRIDELAVNDLDAAWDVLKHGSGLADAYDLLERLVVALNGDGLSC